MTSIQRIWHTLDLEETFTALDSNHIGLKKTEIERRLVEFGTIEIETGHKVSIFAILLAQIKNPLVYVQLAAAIVSILAGKTIDAILIAVEQEPSMQTASGTYPLCFGDWGLIVMFSGSIFIADELRKLVHRQFGPHAGKV